MNRFGRTLWRRDFAPYGVHLAHVIHIPGSWYRPDQQNPVKYVNDNSLDRLQHQRPPVTLAFLSHPAKGVFARDDSINSDRCDNQMAVLGPNGKLLDQRSYSESFGLRAYDFAPVFNMNSFREVESEKGGEKLVLFQLQNFQGMYPSALVIGKGTSYSVLCSPGVILEAQVLRNDSRGISMLVLAANNLFSHMNYLTEWNCSPLAGRHTEIFPAYFTNHNYTTEEFPVFFPRISGIIENHWLKEGRVVLFDTEEGRTITVFRDGKMQITRDGKVQTYRDLPAVLARAYGLVNECFQQKAVRRNPQKALELAADAATLPVQNPFLRSALLCLRGECEALLGRNDESRKSFGQALYHFPRNNDAMKGLLEVEFFEKGAPAAIALFERAYSQGKNFFGLGDSGNYLFLGYAHLAAGQAEKAREYFEKIYQGHFPDSRETLQGILEMFAGNYKQAVRHLVQAESKVPGFFDIRELRLLLARALVLADYDPVRARWILEDLAKFSLRQGHMTEISLCHLLAREGKLAEARARVGPAFAKLRQVAAGDFETRLWLWYDAFVYARTMELLGNPAGARDGYAACVESNPHTALATEARQALAKQ
jgi:tetratricopeptide (TPR) repeat protein